MSGKRMGRFWDCAEKIQIIAYNLVPIARDARRRILSPAKPFTHAPQASNDVSAFVCHRANLSKNGPWKTQLGSNPSSPRMGKIIQKMGDGSI